MLPSYNASGNAAGGGFLNMSTHIKNTILDISDLPSRADPYSVPLGVQKDASKQVATIFLSCKLCTTAFINEEVLSSKTR